MFHQMLSEKLSDVLILRRIPNFGATRTPALGAHIQYVTGSLLYAYHSFRPLRGRHDHVGSIGLPARSEQLQARLVVFCTQLAFGESSGCEVARLGW